MRLTWNLKKKKTQSHEIETQRRKKKNLGLTYKEEREKKLQNHRHHGMAPSSVSCIFLLSLSDLALMVPSRHSTATIVTTFCHCYFFYHCHRWIVCSLCLLTHLSNFASIIWYLLYDLQTYFLYIILNYKNFKFKQLIDDITINL